MFTSLVWHGCYGWIALQLNSSLEIKQRYHVSKYIPFVWILYIHIFATAVC